MHNVITGPATEVRGQAGIFDVFALCFFVVFLRLFFLAVVFVVSFARVVVFVMFVQTNKNRNKNLQEPTKPTRTY